MIDHVGLNVNDLDASKRFYEAALAPLGLTLQMQFGRGAGFGMRGKPTFWVMERAPHGNAHVAFHCESREPVDRFYEAALAAGGRDNGGPAERPLYHPGYYAAFVLDPDGNNVEAVCHHG